MKIDPKRFPRYADVKLAATVAKTLDKADVPYVLWGNLALHVLGVPVPPVVSALRYLPPSSLATQVQPPKPQLTQFIIPDDSREAAAAALLASGLRPCPAYGSCDAMSKQTPCPYVHYHFKEGNDTLLLGLFTKSNFLWRLPRLKPEGPAPNNRNITVTSDRRHPMSQYMDGRPCGSGPFPAHLYPVKMLTLPATLNSLITLLCRDVQEKRYRDIWLENLCLLAEYVVTDPDPAGLETGFRNWWREWYDGGHGDIYEITCELREELEKGTGEQDQNREEDEEYGEDEENEMRERRERGEKEEEEYDVDEYGRKSRKKKLIKFPPTPVGKLW